MKTSDPQAWQALEFWRKYDLLESRLTAPVSECMLDIAGLMPGMRVLDLASGRGEPAIRAAQRVGPSGHVLAIDHSEEMLTLARAKVEAQGLTNIELRCEGAESLHLPPAQFDVATSRWGLMYMRDPISALTNTRRSLRPGGVLVAALWATPDRVPYHTLPRVALQRYRAVPALDSEAPGTFRYADLQQFEKDLNRSGFALEVVREMEACVFEASNTAEALDWILGVGLEQLVRDFPHDQRRSWERDVVAMLESSRTGGLIRLGGTTLIARALAVD